MSLANTVTDCTDMLTCVVVWGSILNDLVNHMLLSYAGKCVHTDCSDMLSCTVGMQAQQLHVQYF